MPEEGVRSGQSFDVAVDGFLVERDAPFGTFGRVCERWNIDFSHTCSKTVTFHPYFPKAK